MRLATLIQKPIHGPNVMDAKTMVKLATIEGAKALHLDDQVGSIEVGKKADLIFLDINQTNNSLLNNDANIYSDIVYSSTKNNVSDVMIDGKWVVKESQSSLYDADELTSNGKKELTKLLNRTEIN